MIASIVLALQLAAASPQAPAAPTILDLETTAQKVAADSKAGRWSAASDDYASLQRTWSAVKPRVANVPDAAPRVRDMEGSLTVLKGAIAQKDAKSAATASDNVATTAHELMIDVGKQ